MPGVFPHFRKVGARAAGESVSAVVTVSSTTSPSGPLQSPRDGGPSHLVPWPSVRLQLQAKQGPTPALRDPPPSTQPSAPGTGAASVERLTQDVAGSFPLSPPFSPPPPHAHNIKQGWLDSRCLCLKNLQTLLMTQLKKNTCTDKKELSFPFSICLQEYCDLPYNEDVEKSCETFCDSVSQKEAEPCFIPHRLSHQMKCHEESYHTISPFSALWDDCPFFTHSYQMVLLIWGMIVTPLTF